MPRIRTHPGEILETEYLAPLQMSSAKLAKQLGVPGNRISDIVRQRRAMTADTALRLSRYFRTTPDFWMNLQSAHDLSRAAAEHDYSRIRERA